MKKIAIFGATGFIGQALYHLLRPEYEVYVVSRSSKKAWDIFGIETHIITWSGEGALTASASLEGFYAFVNLIGENIASRPWTKKQKQKIRSSRINSSRFIVNLINSLKSKPEVLIQASAIGFYGQSSNTTLNENSPPGEGFMAVVTREWEAALNDLSPHVRPIIIRTGLVLGSQGGFLKNIAVPFRFFMGGYLGNGKQWLSWIHLQDQVSAIRFLIETQQANGVFNLTAPVPEQFKTFASLLGKHLGRPSWTVIPAFVLRLFLGEMADDVLLASQKVRPDRLNKMGYPFHYTNLGNALKDLIGR